MMPYETPVTGYEQQCVGLLLEKLDAVAFDYDIVGDVMRFARAREGMKEQRLPGFRRALCTKGNGRVHPDFLERFLSILTGRAAASQEVLLDMSETPRGHFSWYEVAAKPVRGAGGKTARMRGVLWDIAPGIGEMEQSFVRFRSERDPVTGILNGTGMKKAVDMYLHGQGHDESNALLFVSLDDFSQAAQLYGKRWADGALLSACKAIGALFRAGDLLAHLGDGRFVIFLKAPRDGSIVGAREESLAELSYAQRPGHGEEGLPCQVSTAYYPEDGTSFQDLLHTAERRLKQQAFQA